MKYISIIIFTLLLIPQLAFAQLSPETTVKGNRRILTQEEASTTAKKEAISNFNKTKVVYVFGAIGLLIIAGFGAVQLIGPSKKPKLKE